VVGTAVIAVGLVLLSRMDQGTSVTASSAAMLVFGAGLGMVMQVLVIAVQNVVDYRDLGVATSGVTFSDRSGRRSAPPSSVPSSAIGWSPSWPATCLQEPCPPARLPLRCGPIRRR
jgi:hypothetical protein